MNGFKTATLMAFALGLAACATGPGTSPAPAASADKPEAPARPFIERSLVLAPESIGEFVLEDLSNYPDHPASGAGLRYMHGDFPDVLVNLFVYPIGRVDQSGALTHGMSQLRAELAAMTDQGRYRELDYGQEIHFDLDEVAEDGRLMPSDRQASVANGETGEASKEEQFQAIAAEVEAAMDTSLGRRLSLSFLRRDEPMNSVAFLFYRGLYLYKGRITTSATAMPAENFDRFANRAMALIVPAVQVRSTGGCVNREINVNPDAGNDELQRQLLRGLVESNTRAENEKCAAELDLAVPEGHRSQLLEYPASMWR